jgi:iron complex outermembrane receptor protein
VGAAGGIINYISRVPTKMGDEFQLSTRYTTQFQDDSGGYKVGLNWFHKSEDFDLVVSGSHIDRGMTWDAQPRRIGLNTSGSTADSKANNLFIKGGFDFGTDKAQRLQFSASKFKIEGNNRYRLVDGDRATGSTNTSELGVVPGSRAEFNDFEQYTASYSNNQVFGGTFTADAYIAKQAMRYPAENGDDRQDPLIAPLGTLWDQSEIYAKKKGLRTSWTRGDVFSVSGLELRTGIDLVEDNVQQRLALTDRLWVPPMIYKSVAPYAQLSYDIGPLTLSGGLRHEDGRLHVDNYTTTYYRNRVAVGGGTLGYTSNLPNLGAVWRFAPEWSAFVSTGKGFSLPNVGIPLRNINYPGQTVAGILDLQAIIVKNQEVGVNWRGRNASFGGSVYKSKSDLGVSLSIDPVTNDFVMNRAPVEINGFELSGDYTINRDVKITGLYSRILGKTTFVKNGPLDKRMGVNDINPDKLGGSVNWKFMPGGDVNLGFTKLMSRDLNVGGPSGEEHTTGYTLFDLGANYDFGRYGKATLGVENLTNKFYVLSWSQLPGFRNYWSGRGRVVSISHTLTF